MRKTIDKDAVIRLFYHEKNMILEVWNGTETTHIQLPTFIENIKLEGNEVSVIPKDQYLATDGGSVIQRRATPLCFLLHNEERARQLMIAIMAGRSSSTDYSVTC